MAVGRPSIYSQELVDRICDELRIGRSITSLCNHEDWCPSLTTVMRWLRENQEFRQQYTLAREDQAEVMADQITDIADDGTNDYVERATRNGTQVLCDTEHINRSRLRVDARKWVASKLLPKKYGDKIQQEHTGKDGEPLKFILERIG